MGKMRYRESGNFIYSTGNYKGTFRLIPLIGKWFGWYKLTWVYHP